MRLLESTVFLRSLNYLRIRHGYARSYNWVYPAIVSFLLTWLVLSLVTPATLFEKDGLLSSFTPFLSILSPFYIASLAAVSTFSGNRSVDEKFGMTEPVLLEIRGAGGGWEWVDVTPRHFLSLLFGYCTAVSLFLLLTSIFSSFISIVVMISPSQYHDLIFSMIFLAFSFFLCQLLLCTLLGVYFLSDRIHRK